MIARHGHGKPVDLWALGCITYELVFGIPPFNECNSVKLYEKIKYGKVYFDIVQDVKTTNSFKDFIN